LRRQLLLISLYTVETEELEASQGDMVLFIQQWKPSVYQFGDMFQMAVPTSADVSLFKSKV